MDERRLLKQDSSEWKASRLNLCFFWMGSGSVVTYNALVMAVAHFRLNDNGFGPKVLTQFALWHNILLLFTMLVVFFWPKKPSVKQHVVLLLAAFGFGVAFNAALLASFAFRSAPPAWALYATVAVNGAATGVACSIGASLSGIFETYSFSRGPGVSQLRGVAFGIAVPTAVQLCTLPLVAVTSLETQTTLAAALSAGAALIMCGGAIASTANVAASRDSFFEARAQEEDYHPAAEQQHLDTIGECVSCGQKEFVKERMRKVAPMALAQFLNTFALVAMLLLSPKLPTTSHFWQAYMPTLAIASNNIFGYFGRRVVLGAPASRRAVYSYALCSPAGLVAIATYTSSWKVNPILIYSVVALFSGRATVVFSQKAQEACGHSHEWVCPIVAQINFIGIESGALVAAVLLLVLV